MKIFQRRVQTTLGLSFEDEELLWVQTHKPKKRDKYIVDYGRIALPPGGIIDGEIFDQDRVIHALAPIANLEADQVVMSLEPGMYTAHHVTINLETGIMRSRLKKKIEKGLDRYLLRELGISRETIVCEYDIVRLNTNAGEVELYLTMYNKALLARYRDTLSRLGYKNVSFEPTQHVLAQHYLSSTGATMMAHVGAHETTLSIMVGRRMMANAIIPFGHRMMVDIIAAHLEYDEKDAKKILNKFGILNSHRDPNVLKALYLATDTLVGEIEHVMHQWESGAVHPDASVHPILEVQWYGPGVEVEGLIEYVNDRIELSMGRVDPWHLLPTYNRMIPPIDAKEVLSFIPPLMASIHGFRE